MRGKAGCQGGRHPGVRHTARAECVRAGGTGVLLAGQPARAPLPAHFSQTASQTPAKARASWKVLDV